MQSSQNKKSTTKRKRLTLEEQIAKQKELLAKEQESLEKKQKRLRSLNASKMNKDRKEAQKKRNSMLIQLGLLFINMINWLDEEEEPGIKINQIKFLQETVIEKIKLEENIIREKYNDINSKEIKKAYKLLNDKKIMLEALQNMEENYLKYGKARI